MNLPEPDGMRHFDEAADLVDKLATCDTKGHWLAEILLYRKRVMAAAVAQEREWVPVSERLPRIDEFCDWLYPSDPIKHQRWVLCGEAMFTATVPGDATHWRLSKPLPAAIRATPTEGSK